MEEIVAGFLADLVGDYLKDYVMGKIRNLLKFEAVTNVDVIYNNYKLGLLRTSRKAIEQDSYFGSHPINKILEYEFKIEQETLSVREDGLTIAELRFSIPLFTSFVQWKTAKDLSESNIKRFRAFPDLYKIGSFYLESTWPDLNAPSPFLSDVVYFDRPELLKKVNTALTEDMREDSVNHRSFTASIALDAPSQLLKGTEKYWWALEATGNVTTYGWPITIIIQGRLNIPEPEPSGGTLG